MTLFPVSSFRLVLLFLGLLLLLACSKTYSWNQKLTVTVMTPGGEVSASSVMEVTLTETSGKFVPPEARGVKSKLRGEAVVLEVTPGKYLFVLLGGVEQLARSAFPQFPYESSSEFGRWARQIENHRGSGTVPREKYPLMVTFEDVKEPVSVKRVDPQDLGATFGEGVELIGLEAELTDEPVTLGTIPSLFPWWEQYENQQLDGRRITYLYAKHRFANSLNRLNFKKDKR